MKRGTDLKLKFKMLRKRLGLSYWQTKGVLQAIWDFTAENAQRGDIGRFSNAEIAIGIEWPEDDADRLIECLLETGWIDTEPEHRLVVHEWHEHCEEWIKKRVERAGEAFVSDNGRQRQTVSAARQTTADNGSLPGPGPAPGPRKKTTSSSVQTQTGVWGSGPITLDTKARRWLGVTDEDLSEWADAYPACDVPGELRRALEWCLSNPAKGRKKLYRKFLTGWLTRQQDRGGSQRGTSNPYGPRTGHNTLLDLGDENA